MSRFFGVWVTISLNTFFVDVISSTTSSATGSISSPTVGLTVTSTFASFSTEGSGADTSGVEGSSIDSVFFTDSCDCFRSSASRSARETCWTFSFEVDRFKLLASTVGF
ncbi:MAG: hypothetical protein CMA41_01275 [Euryarchaeota archaeon]|nr:hypothetical protein [Euryarchaeota archaeon]